MIRHQDVGIEHELVPVLVSVEARQVCLIISLTPEHMPTLIPASDDMVKNSWKLNAGQTSHASFIPRPPKIVNINIPMSDPNLLTDEVTRRGCYRRRCAHMFRPERNT